MNKVKLLVISYLNPRKNIDFVINQVNKLNNFELHIIGDGESKYVDYLKSISGKNIFFHGLKFGSDKKDFLIKSDFLIFHTLKDVWGLVVHEAMYFGLPVIASKNVPSARQILKHCKCGFIYNNESEFLRILHYINEEMSKEEYNEMSLKAKIFMDKFNEEAYENWKKFLET
jgi:glycosyltransferase involved in cell wall biosynthesis